MSTFSIDEYGSHVRSSDPSWRYLRDTEIRLIDLNSLGQTSFERELELSLCENGFLIIKCPDAILALHQTTLREAALFFSLPTNLRVPIRFDAIDQRRFGNVGYFPFGTEKAVSHNVPDAKEFVHFGQRLFREGPLIECYPGNAWLNDYPAFQRALQIEFDALIEIAESIFPIIGNLFGLDRSYLNELSANGNSILRAIHYPPTSGNNEKAMRAAPHHGMNLMGLQPPSTSCGLQFCRNHDNEWVALPDLGQPTITVNLGRMFAYLTNGRVSPTVDLRRKLTRDLH